MKTWVAAMFDKGNFFSMSNGSVLTSVFSADCVSKVTWQSCTRTSRLDYSTSFYLSIAKFILEVMNHYEYLWIQSRHFIPCSCISNLPIVHMLRWWIYNLKRHVEIGHRRTNFKRKQRFRIAWLSAVVSFFLLVLHSADVHVQSRISWQNPPVSCEMVGDVARLWLLADKLVNSLRWNHDMMCMCALLMEENM